MIIGDGNSAGRLKAAPSDKGCGAYPCAWTDDCGLDPRTKVQDNARAGYCSVNFLSDHR